MNGLQFLWDHYDMHRIATSTIAPEATDEELFELEDMILTGTLFARRGPRTGKAGAAADQGCIGRGGGLNTARSSSRTVCQFHGYVVR